MAELKQIDSPNAPGAVGAYSQAIGLDKFIFTSGSLPIDPETKVMPEDVREQATRVLENLRAILATAGSAMENVVKATIFLSDINDFAAVNEVYSKFFQKPYPARSCYAVSALPLGAKVEIEVVAVKN